MNEQGAQEVAEMKSALAGDSPAEAVESEAAEPDKPDSSSFTVGNLIGQK